MTDLLTADDRKQLQITLTVAIRRGWPMLAMTCDDLLRKDRIARDVKYHARQRMLRRNKAS